MTSINTSNKLQTMNESKNMDKNMKECMKEYNLNHKQKMKWVFYDICSSRCMTCNKIIFHYVYALRNTDMHCCSEKCVDNYVPTYNYGYY